MCHVVLLAPLAQQAVRNGTLQTCTSKFSVLAELVNILALRVVTDSLCTHHVRGFRYWLSQA